MKRESFYALLQIHIVMNFNLSYAAYQIDESTTRWSRQLLAFSFENWEALACTKYDES